MDTQSQARLLLSTGSLYSHDLAYNFELAAATGWDGVELMAGDSFATRDPRYLRQLSDRYGVAIPVVHSPFRPNPPGWGRPNLREMVTRSVELAEEIGAETVVMHLPAKFGFLIIGLGTKRRAFPWPANPQRELKQWIESGGLAAFQEGTAVKIAVENLPLHHDRLIPGMTINAFHWNTITEWAAVHPWLTLDTTHWGTHDVDPVKAYQAAGTKVTHVHLSNLYRKGYKEHRLPHDGDLDLANFLQTLAVNGFAGTISLEVHPDALEFTDDHALRRNLTVSLRFCREHLSQGVPT